MKKYNWKKKNVLITGINGFIGGNLCKLLLQEGANIVGLVRNENKSTFMYYEGLNKKVIIIKGDIVDSQTIQTILSEHNINFVFHLAAQVEVGVGLSNPYLTFETNVRGTYTLLESCRVYGKNIESIIIASSDKSYGSYPENKMPYKENYPLNPLYPYDTSKACTDLIAKSFAASYENLPIIITRFSNIYGPGQLNFSAIIPDCIRSALGYSEFVPRGNGNSIRDFIFVEDVCYLYKTIAQNLSCNGQLSGEIFNAGTNKPISIKTLVSKIFLLINEEYKLKSILQNMNDKNSFGEIDCQYMDYLKVQKYFGWKPATDLSSGLDKTVHWFKSYLLEQKIN